MKDKIYWSKILLIKLKWTLIEVNKAMGKKRIKMKKMEVRLKGKIPKK